MATRRMKQLAKIELQSPKQFEERLRDGLARQQIALDAYLRIALRMVCQHRRIEELKRLCGVK
jgi:hypothetical protein